MPCSVLNCDDSWDISRDLQEKISPYYLDYNVGLCLDMTAATSSVVIIIRNQHRTVSNSLQCYSDTSRSYSGLYFLPFLLLLRGPYKRTSLFLTITLVFFVNFYTFVSLEIKINTLQLFIIYFLNRLMASIRLCLHRASQKFWLTS